MTLAPYMTAESIVQLHIVLAIMALLLGPVALYRKRRDRLHKTVGYVWVLAMGGTALSSFGISSFALIGPFSPIHLLAVLALWSLWQGMRAILRRNIDEHKEVMGSLYWNGLLVAGAFQFLPGRSTNRVFFAENPEQGYIVLALVIAGIFARIQYRRTARLQTSAA